MVNIPAILQTTIFCLLLFCAQCLLTACSPVKTAVTNQYKLSSYSNKQLASHPTQLSILVTQPEAVAGYQTEEMLYMQKPFELSPFANNAWVDPPADMLFPLILQSLQRSGYFYAVASSPTADKTDYRLHTQLIEIHQNFLKKPSELEFIAKVVLTRVKDSQIVASRLISQRAPCPMENPYGGVIAANRAVSNFTAEMTEFVLRHVQADSRR